MSDGMTKKDAQRKAEAEARGEDWEKKKLDKKTGKIITVVRKGEKKPKKNEMFRNHGLGIMGL